ncbi:MAG: hypothetical protein EXS52_01260 [Candidatus Staskawiczbacteria bacterium]|nr:hypothetical protein [Candidatus Staskawiczbacteria bacterium]
MKRKNKKDTNRDWDYYTEPKPLNPQKGLFDEDELAEKLAELFIKQVEKGKIIKDKNQNNEN